MHREEGHAAQLFPVELVGLNNRVKLFGVIASEFMGAIAESGTPFGEGCRKVLAVFDLDQGSLKCKRLNACFKQVSGEEFNVSVGMLSCLRPLGDIVSDAKFVNSLKGGAEEVKVGRLKQAKQGNCCCHCLIAASRWSVVFRGPADRSHQLLLVGARRHKWLARHHQKGPRRGCGDQRQ